VTLVYKYADAIVKNFANSSVRAPLFAYFTHSSTHDPTRDSDLL
jgi:hypothetical protein|tara:strand:- start:539 stop:670 length:132 start_codon:yes stop_codon:yes gene_type:complete